MAKARFGIKMSSMIGTATHMFLSELLPKPEKSESCVLCSPIC